MVLLELLSNSDLSRIKSFIKDLVSSASKLEGDSSNLTNTKSRVSSDEKSFLF